MITVISRKRLGDPWENQSGKQMFPYVVNLSDGSTIMANGASEDPWWREGTPVIFKDNGNKTKSGLSKGSFDKPEGVIPTATPAANVSRVAHGDREIGMRVGMSINNACNLLRGSKLSGEEFDTKLEALARSIYTVAERITSNPSGAEAPAATADEETPF
tara:strand:+ start:421 stop:900 length:480 start_codon:yes stop_codon:yes gene_type:complete